MAQYLDALELFEKNCMTEYLAIKVCTILRAVFTLNLFLTLTPPPPSIKKSMTSAAET